jgi:hypothetical protein
VKDKPGSSIPVFLDLLPNAPKTDQSREKFRQILRERFEQRLPNSVDRIWLLPPLILKPEGEYLALLLEARDLFVDGRFYACVAMCGIVGERLIKDLMRASVLVQTSSGPQTPPTVAFDQLERIQISGVIRFLNEANLLSEEAKNAAIGLTEMRNKYAHARGMSPQSDSLKAIEQLHLMVENTVSMFKDYEIRGGTFAIKAKSPKTE